MLGKVFKKTKRIIRACDLFRITQLLRYRQNPEYKSANGGLCSLAVILAFVIIFTQTILSTFDKIDITSQTTLFEETEPTNFKTVDTPFLFAVGVSNFDMNDPVTRYFDVEITQKISNPKQTINLKLEKCNRDVWTRVDPNVGPTFDRLKFHQWLCLPENTTLEFQGKYSSEVFKYLRISLKKCGVMSPAPDNRTCADQSIIASQLSKATYLSLNYYFINTIINPDNTEYLKTYLEDRHFFTFTFDYGTKVNIFVSSFKIKTDQSLWPISEYSEDTGGFVYEPTQSFIYKPTVVNTEYVQLYIRKSSLSLSIERKFRKYDDTISYIGGLFSSIMAALFIMAKYNEYGYEIQITSSIYKESRRRKIQSDSFNLLTFFSYFVYVVLRFIGVNPNWKTLKQFDSARHEIGKQLDLKLVLRKLSFLEDCMQFLFQDFQLKCLHLKGKLTLHEAAKIRRRFSSRAKFLKITKKQAQIEEENKAAQQSKKYLNNQFQLPKYERIQIRSINDRNIESDQKVNADHLGQSVLENAVESKIIEKTSFKLDESVSDVQSDNQDEEKGFYDDIIKSLQKLQVHASQGQGRCAKIYRSLDKMIKNMIPKDNLDVPAENTTPNKNLEDGSQQNLLQNPDNDFQFDFQELKST